jgi:hypothetical protein
MSTELDDLDYAVALADGWAPATAPAYWTCKSQRPLKRGSDYMCWDCQGARFSRDWSDGGPLLERHGVWLARGADGMWGADIPGKPGDPAMSDTPKRGDPGHVRGTGWGETPLIAGMRAIVDAAPSRTDQGEGR